MLKRFVAMLLLVSFASEVSLFAVDGKKAAYFGGTAAVFAGAKDPVEGVLNTADPNDLILTAEKKPFAKQELRIPYENVVDLEYGQKAGRRVGAAVPRRCF